MPVYSDPWALDQLKQKPFDMAAFQNCKTSSSQMIFFFFFFIKEFYTAYKCTTVYDHAASEEEHFWLIEQGNWASFYRLGVSTFLSGMEIIY